jgi:hypothetical protein
MASDYQAISQFNVEQLGKKTKSRQSQVCMYADPTHFIYEIIQNADDYDATEVIFNLFPDRLIIEHNGIPFNNDNVKAISDIGESTSQSDLIKTGHFGLGFKSVFAFTATPIIHSGDENFEIYGLYRLRASTPLKDLPDLRTRIILPFNHEEMKPDYIYEEKLISPKFACERISTRLKNLNMAILLFTRNIREICWKIDNEEGHYLREDNDIQKYSQLLEIRKTLITDGEKLQSYLIFSRPIYWDDKKYRPVEIAFKLDNNCKIITDRQKLFVLFATEVDTYLKFILNGPYRTNPARETVDKEDAFNIHLIQETAFLLREGLPVIKELGLLKVAFLEVLPIRSDDFKESNMFLPIFQIVREALIQEDFLPTHNGKYTSAKKAKLARASDLRDIITDVQLQLLYGSDTPLHWLSEEITSDKTPDLRKYLLHELGIKELDAEDIASKITLGFLKEQADEWMVRFYSFLHDKPALWRASRWQNDAPGPLRNREFIRLEGEQQQHVKPFRENGSPYCYLPPQEDTEFSIVSRNIASDQAAYEFFKKLGLTEPDIVAEVIEKILPKYSESTTSQIPIKEHELDIAKIFRALKTDSAEKKERLRKALLATPFVYAVNNSSEENAYKKPGEIYFRTQDLEIYFRNNSDAWFLDEEGKDEWLNLGVEDKPRRIPFDPNFSWEEQKPLIGTQGHTRTISTIDYLFDGLDCFLNTSSELNDQGHSTNRALILWNFLLEHLDRSSTYSRDTFFQGTYKWFYRNEHSQKFEARWVKALKRYAWLPSRKGGFFKSNEISLEDLPDDFTRDENLRKNLGLKLDEEAKAAEKLNITMEEIELIRLIRKYPEVFQKPITSIQEKEKPSSYPEDPQERICCPSNDQPDYRAELEKSFYRPGKKTLQDGHYPEGFLPNPERRREREAEKHIQRIQEEPDPKERRRTTERTILEGPDEQVRQYLGEWYHGKCQICEKSFPQRSNGRPFFIANYIVPREKARQFDTYANALCFCAEHFAKWQHGAVEAEEIINQIETFKLRSEGGDDNLQLKIKLCGEECYITFNEKHIISLQELLKAHN